MSGCFFGEFQSFNPSILQSLNPPTLSSVCLSYELYMESLLGIDAIADSSLKKTL